ncbi:MAG: DUF2202 domain-containing protein [Saprospiraceae bacterium]|nr:DUF2202 domain-containing protein [Saprospiraceae bacterium]
MKKIILLFSISLSVVFSSCYRDLNITDTSRDPQQRPDFENKREISCQCLFDLYPVENLSDREREALYFMREEEKLAMDVYQYLYDKWKHHVFENISNSERQHMSLILCLIDKYGLEDPSEDLAQGEFRDKNLTEFYDLLISEGTKSLINAFIVGATIEDVDIFDLMHYQANGIDNWDVNAVFQELNKGSRNHMRAFTKNLKNLGAGYESQYISSGLLEEIIESERETGDIICSDT